MHRLATVSSAPLLATAVLAATLGGYVMTRRFLERELSAPRLSDSRINEHRSPARTDDPDLDGDGITDRFDGIFESCGAAGCAYEVYLRRPDGADVYVGRMVGFWPFRIEPRDDRPADVIAPAQRDPNGPLAKRFHYVAGAGYR